MGGVRRTNTLKPPDGGATTDIMTVMDIDGVVSTRHGGPSTAWGGCGKQQNLQNVVAA